MPLLHDPLILMVCLCIALYVLHPRYLTHTIPHSMGTNKLYTITRSSALCQRPVPGQQSLKIIKLYCSYKTTHLSCLSLLASARCSSSMMQLGGNGGCMPPRCGDTTELERGPRKGRQGPSDPRGGSFCRKELDWCIGAMATP